METVTHLSANWSCVPALIHAATLLCHGINMMALTSALTEDNSGEINVSVMNAENSVSLW